MIWRTDLWRAIGFLIRRKPILPRSFAPAKECYGTDARIRYRALLTAALRRIAADPQGLSTVDRSDLFDGVRSFHIRHSRAESREAPVGDPVHVVFYRIVDAGVVEIARVLHERMEPSRQFGTGAEVIEKPEAG